MRPLRILIVTQSYHPVHGGIGEHARHLGLSLRKRGHRVRILTAGPKPAAGELPGLEIVRIGRRIEVSSNGSRATIAWHPLYRSAVRAVTRENVDVVHIHSPLEPFLPWAVIREAQVPCIGTFHNAGTPHWGYRRLSRLLAPLAERLSVRTAVSRCAASYAGRHFPGEFLIVPNGVDADRFRPPEAERNSRPPTVLFVGRLEPRKGLHVLVDGVAAAAKYLPRKPRLLIVGDGSLREMVLQRTEQAGIPLEWRGNVGIDEIASCYHEADLLAAPALYGESFGIVLLEALASGLPVIASRIEGFEELLDRCPGARLFPPGEKTALGVEIASLLRRPVDRALRAMIRRHAMHYSWNRVAAAMEDVYLEALAGPPAEVQRVRFPSAEDVEVGGRVDCDRSAAGGKNLEVFDGSRTGGQACSGHRCERGAGLRRRARTG